jgi:DNA repair exonuclease SbcCD ATPase subunit
MSSDMSSAPARRPTPSEKDPLLRLANQLPEAQDREWYAQLISYIHTLEPTDELVKIAQLFGFLTMMGHKLPEAIQEKQSELRDMLLKAHMAFREQVQTNVNYHAELSKRLSQLPAEIADGVKPEAIVKAMSESFRQQIQNTGLQKTQMLLTAAAGELRTTTRALDAAVKPITARYTSLASEVEKQAASLTTQSNNLATTADKIQNQNAQFVAQAQNLSWWSLLAVTVFALLVGVFCGITWEQRNVGSLVVDLQTQVGELQQIIKNLPATLNPPPPPKKQKKGQ